MNELTQTQKDKVSQGFNVIKREVNWFLKVQNDKKVSSKLLKKVIIYCQILKLNAR